MAINFSVHGASPGRPPIVDAVLSVDGKKVALEAKQQWTSTIAQLLLTRADRVLLSPEIDAFVLIVPDEHADKARDELRNGQVVVIAVSELSRLPELVRKALRHD